MKDIVTKGTGIATTTIMAEEALGAMFDLRWMIVLSLFLIAADFWLGTNVSRMKNVEIRFSRAWRRTVSKFWEYILYLLGGALLGLAILEPMGIASHVLAAAVCLTMGCTFELHSIVSHVYYIRTGKDLQFNVVSFGLSLIKSKHSEIGEAIEEGMKKGKKKKSYKHLITRYDEHDKES